jgi:hypothetical protein
MSLDITGERYSRLIAIRYVGIRNGHNFWLFRCDCGTEKQIDLSRVRRGDTRSCGCLGREMRHRKHPPRQRNNRSTEWIIDENGNLSRTIGEP